MPRRTSARRREYEKRGEKGRRKEERKRLPDAESWILRWGINWYASSIRHVGRMKEGDPRQCLSAEQHPIVHPVRFQGSFRSTVTHINWFSRAQVRQRSTYREYARRAHQSMPPVRSLDARTKDESSIRRFHVSQRVVIRYPLDDARCMKRQRACARARCGAAVTNLITTRHRLRN